MADLVWVAVTLKAETEKAWQVDAGMGKDQWIPKSQIMDYSDPDYTMGSSIEIEIPEWLAFEKGLI